MVGPKAEDHLTNERAGGHATTGRFEPEKPAGRGWHTNRSAHVVSVGQGYHARGDCSGRAAARSSGRSLQIPGISTRPEQRRLSRKAEPKLGKIGLTEGDQPGSTVSNHQ